MNNITLKQLNEFFIDELEINKTDDGITISFWCSTLNQQVYLDIAPNNQPPGKEPNGVLMNVEMFEGSNHVDGFIWEPGNENE